MSHVPLFIWLFDSMTMSEKQAFISTMDLSSLLGLTVIAQADRSMIQSNLNACWEHFLSGILPGPIELLLGMEETCTLISGPAALSFLNNRHAPPVHDVHFFCSKDGFHDFTTKLVAIAKDSFPEFTQEQHLVDNNSGITEATTIHTPLHSLLVLRSATNCALTAVALQPTTLFTNFLTARGFCIAYPWLYEAKVVLYNPLTEATWDRSTYEVNGYTFLSSARQRYHNGTANLSCVPYSCCGNHFRFFGDQYSLHYRYSQAPIEEEQQRRTTTACPRFSLTNDYNAIWLRGGDACKTEFCYVHATKFTLPVD